MTEQYLFRGWRKDGGGWVEGWYTPHDDGTVTIWDMESDTMVYPESVSVATGREDKNGKMVYGGCRLMSETSMWTVVWDIKRLQWMAEDIEGEKIQLHVLRMADYEIVSTEWENKMKEVEHE